MPIEPFFTTKGLAEATGLSLATCYGTVQRAGGHIAVETSPGRGADFRIYLPRTADAPRARPAPIHEVAAETRGGTERVLVVEDEPALRQMVALTLRDRGYEVLEAADGQEALELVERGSGGPLGMVLSDVIMPRMGGKDLADRLQHIAPALPVLLMSGYTGSTLADHGVGSGVRVLEKPMSADELLRSVRACLDRRLEAHEEARS